MQKHVWFHQKEKIENKTFYEMIQYSVHENPNKKELYFTIVYYTSKLWYYGTLIYYGKTMVLLKKLWYYGKKLWYTIPRTMELRFTKERNTVDYQKLRNFHL